MDKNSYYIIAVIESYENIITESGATVTLYVTPDYTLTPNTSLALTVDPPNLEWIEHLGELYGKPWSFHYVKANLNEFEQLHQEVKNKTLDKDELEVKNKIEILRAGISKTILDSKDSYTWKLTFEDDSLVTDNTWNELCKFNKLGKQVCAYFTDNGLTITDIEYKWDGGGIKSWNEVKISGWKS